MIRIIAALLVIGIWCAPLAEADSTGEQLYLNAIHGNYFSQLHTDSEWLREAYKICDLHLSGTDNDQLMDMVEADLNVPATVSPTVVGSAEGAMGC
jgi:hypothetical protein